MDVAELKREKRDLENRLSKRIHSCISEFENDSGVDVDGIGISIHRIMIEGGATVSKTFEVKITLDI